MPELPEVETVVRDLRTSLTGKTLRSVQAGRRKLRTPWKAIWSKELAGRHIVAVERRGKWILVNLEGGPILLLHLGMTGQLVVMPAAQEVTSHTHLIFDLDDGSQQLRFRDIRRFGSARLYSSLADLERFFTASGLGPEPFDLQPAYWRARLAGTIRCLKAILLDQRVIAGVGNIYADESLFQSRLHPKLRGTDLNSRAAERLHEAIEEVLKRAIERRGSSIRDYVGGSGLRGEYQNEFRVYGRTGDPCVRCATPIVRIVLAGRSTHYCPRCQKAPTRRQRHAGARQTRVTAVRS